MNEFSRVNLENHERRTLRDIHNVLEVYCYHGLSHDDVEGTTDGEVNFKNQRGFLV